MLAIDKGRPKVMNLRELLQCFLDHRFEVTRRRTKFDLAKAEARAHILEGLKIALDNLDAVVKIIRASNRTATRRGCRLISRFGLSAKSRPTPFWTCACTSSPGWSATRSRPSTSSLSSSSTTCATCWPATARSTA
jgi:hypothetical protein